MTDEQAVYLQLGEKIWDQVPYDYQGIPDLGEWLTPLDGPAKDCNRDNPLSRVDVQTAAASGVISEESIRANPLSCLYWYFGNTPHAVTKAMRFEYRVKSEGTPQDRDADADGYVTKHILIGFEGVVAGA